jgi:hypothetical protein
VADNRGRRILPHRKHLKIICGVINSIAEGGAAHNTGSTTSPSIHRGHPFHSEPEPSGDPLAAWEWRQLHDELERRANVSLDELQQRIEQLGMDLLGITSQLVEKLTWVSLIRQTTHEQKQALGAYAAMRNKLTKTGKGVRDAELRAAARREMTVAKGQ